MKPVRGFFNFNYEWLIRMNGGGSRERWIRRVCSSSILELIFENLKQYQRGDNFRTISFLRAFLSFVIHRTKWNSKRIRNRFDDYEAKTIRPLSIIIKIEVSLSSGAVGNSRIIVGGMDSRTRKQRIGRIGLGGRGTVQISGRGEGWKSFLPLTKISNNWPENERLWRIKRGHHRKTSL